MMSPRSIEQIHCQTSADERCALSSSAMITPCDSGRSKPIMDQWMASNMWRSVDDFDETNEYVSQKERTEISMAIFGILRDNIPPSLEAENSEEDLMLIAESIERKLYQTASSPRAYCAFSTLELRITALATAVLVHTDKGRNENEYNGYQVVSDTCARLSAAARRSLVYCIMVLISYEKRNMRKAMRKRGVPRVEKNIMGCMQCQETNRNTTAAEEVEGMNLQRTAEYQFCQQVPNKYAGYCQFEKSAYNDINVGRGLVRPDVDNGVDTQMHMGSSKQRHQFQMFPPSA